VARRHFQTGCLFKRGKRRMVWVARWREDVLIESGKVGRILRSVVLGSVSDLPTRAEAQARLEEQLQPVNQGLIRPEAAMVFGTSADTQWQTLVLPTLKLSTQHGYKNVLRTHVLPYWKNWRLRDIGRADIQRWVADRFRQRQGRQTVRNSWVLLSGILETAIESGYLTTNSACGVKFPQKELREGPAIIAGAQLAKLLANVDEPHRTMVSLIAATGSALESCSPCARECWISRTARLRSENRCSRGASSGRRRRRLCGRFRWGRTRSPRSTRTRRGSLARSRTILCSETEMGTRSASRRCFGTSYNPPPKRQGSGG
jgi:hypothetical protein